MISKVNKTERNILLELYESLGVVPRAKQGKGGYAAYCYDIENVVVYVMQILRTMMYDKHYWDYKEEPIEDRNEALSKLREFISLRKQEGWNYEHAPEKRIIK